MKVFVVNGSREYYSLFEKLGFELAGSVSDAELFCFTGGEDVSPDLYGDKKHPYTGNSPGRDEYEAFIFGQALKRHAPMVGICRGGQFLNVMSGGRMYQHVEKHCGSHAITDLLTGDVIQVTSTHHQMMMPAPSGLLVASSALGGSREWYEGQVFTKDVSKEDIEVVFYEHTNCLCFQPHPEFAGAHNEGMRDYFASLLERFFHIAMVKA